MWQIGVKDPYTDLPRATVRGLPDLDREYHYRRMAPPRQFPGMKTVFSTNRAITDLSVMKQFGLVSGSNYERKRRQIESSSRDPWLTRRALPRPDDPEGWTGQTKMCRDVTTETGKGLSGDGYAKLNTLRCCSFMCGKTQWLALREGQLKGGYGMETRSTTAVDTGAAGKLADGSDRYLCRSCAWYRERECLPLTTKQRTLRALADVFLLCVAAQWNEIGLHELPKMEGHLPGYTLNVTSSSDSTEAE